MIRNSIDWLQFDFNGIRLSFVFLLFFSASFFPQQRKKEIRMIDSLIEENNKVYMRYEFLKLIPLSQKIMEKSRKINYEKGLVYGNFYIANALGGIGKFKESNNYINKSQAYKKYLEKDPMQSSRNFALLGNNYQSLELYSSSIKNYQTSIKELKKSKIRDHVIIRTESSLYATLGLLYSEMKKYDSVYYYIIKSKNLIKNMDIKEIEIEKNLLEVDLGFYYLYIKNVDSAKYCFNNAIKKSTLDIPVKIYAYQGLGDLHYKQKNYLEAEHNYLKSIQFIKKSKYPIEDYKIYKNLSQIYNFLGESTKSVYFLDLFNKKQDSLDTAKKVERDIIINDIIKIEKENLLQENRSSMWIYTFLACLSTILVSIFLHYRNRKVVEEKENMVSIKEVENKELKQKLNEAFVEVYQMAKDNSPAFWVRFQEVYPRFKDNLMNVNPNLKPSEFTFCAYIYLGFSSKEISDYTFKASKTIENYRYNVRKKLELLPEKDLMMSIREIADR